MRQALSRYATPLWLAFLALVCAAEIATHTGARSGFLQSSRPLYSINELLPADGYVSWIGTTPVLHDSDGILTLASMFLGERGPQNTGILDRRAAYPYLASLAIPWAGPYAGFLVITWLFWSGAAAAGYWLVLRRTRDRALALVFSLLIAVGHGFIFMAGVPMSYACAYSMVLLLLALAEWRGAFTEGATVRTWLLLGWGAGVAATIYFTHIPVFIFWWLYGLRHAPWRGVLAGTLLAAGISVGWELYGRSLVGLGFSTDNSGAVGDSVYGWIAHLQRSPDVVLEYLRGGPLAGAAAIRGTLLSAFSYPWWVLAAVGLVASSRAEREWLLALAMGGLLPAIVVLSLLPLPRAAFYMYPAVYFCAARGILVLARGARAALSRVTRAPAPPRLGAAVALACCVLVLVAFDNADLLGFPQINARFHNSMGIEW